MGVPYHQLSHPPSIEDIEALAANALATIPEVLRRHCRNVIIRVDDFPDEESSEEMGLDSPLRFIRAVSRHPSRWEIIDLCRNRARHGIFIPATPP